MYSLYFGHVAVIVLSFALKERDSALAGCIDLERFFVRINARINTEASGIERLRIAAGRRLYTAGNYGACRMLGSILCGIGLLLTPGPSSGTKRRDATVVRLSPVLLLLLLSLITARRQRDWPCG